MSRFGSLRTQYFEDAHGTAAGAREMRLARCSMDTQRRLRSKAMDNAEFVRQAQEYIALVHELKQRGDTLAKPMGSAPHVVQYQGKPYILSRRFSEMLPVIVEPARVFEETPCTSTP